MRQYTCIIADDERPALKLLQAYIEKLDFLQLVASCENAFEALSALQKNEVDTLLLDIQMPEMTGLELIQSLQHKPHIILTTAYREYAVQGFEMNVSDYLIKPFSFTRFLQAINKVTDLIKLTSKAESKASNSEITLENRNAEGDESVKTIYVKTNNKIERIDTSEILYLESMREYLGVYTDTRRYIVHKSMVKMMEELPKDHFIRVHRSHIVNLNHISSINGNTIQILDKKIVIGGSYRKAFFNRIPIS